MGSNEKSETMFRIPYLRFDDGIVSTLDEGEELGIEIHCKCGLYSALKFDTPRVPLGILLSKEGYVCDCGKVYRLEVQSTHYHLSIRDGAQR